MPTFLVESYEPRVRAQEIRQLEARARAAARACGGHYIRSILTPEDELCLYVFESPSRERLEEAARATGFGSVRVTEASEFPRNRVDAATRAVTDCQEDAR
jgi:hypothetical protein